jgi:hypothetical protein
VDGVSVIFSRVLSRLAKNHSAGLGRDLDQGGVRTMPGRAIFPGGLFLIRGRQAEFPARDRFALVQLCHAA